MFLALVLVVFIVVSQPCFAIEMSVTRSLQDNFSVSNCSLCAMFNQATCFGKVVCQCPTNASTFFIYKLRCDSSSSWINDKDCLSWTRGKNHLEVIDLNSSSSSPFFTTFDSCSVPLGRTFEYLGRRGHWITHRLQGDGTVFGIERKPTPPHNMSLQISLNNDLVSFAGRIIRVDLLCRGSEREVNNCLILKAKGTISITGNISPSQGNVPTIQHGDISTTLAATSKRITKTETNEPTTPNIHYIGPQSKPRFTPTPSNSTVISQAHINGAVSVDKTNKKGDTVVVAIISVLGAIACVLVIGALFAWFVIKYYKGFRQQDQRSSPRSIVMSNNQDLQNVIPMSAMTTAGRLSEPVYSELPDVVESANRNRFGGPTDITIPIDNQKDFFIIRNPMQYNTLPRARKLTDPLPATPVPDRSVTPDFRLTHRTTSTADPSVTETAQFLSKISKTLHAPVFQDLTRRKRSSTDANSDGVLFENFPAKVLVVNMVDDREENSKPINKSAQSIYEDLSEANKQSRISVYEPLEKATLQPPDVRKTTLERIKDKRINADQQIVFSEEDSAVPQYYVLEPSIEHETHGHENSPTNYQIGSEKLYLDNEDNSGTLPGGADLKGPYSSPMTGHLVQEGPNEDRDQDFANQRGLECDLELSIGCELESIDNKDDSGTLSVGTYIKGPYSSPMTGHLVQEGPNEDRDQGFANQGLEYDKSILDKKSFQALEKIFKDNQSNGLSEPKDGCVSHGLSYCRGRASERIILRPRAKSSEF